LDVESCIGQPFEDEKVQVDEGEDKGVDNEYPVKASVRLTLFIGEERILPAEFLNILKIT
jgi:hypothetical protein